jgi:hypothetical protein
MFRHVIRAGSAGRNRQEPEAGAPCESLALPPVGVQSRVEHELHITTVRECEKTVVLHAEREACQGPLARCGCMACQARRA